MPTFKVTSTRGGAPRVVEAANGPAARAHVAKRELTVTRLTTREAFALSAEGIKLEDAGEVEPVPANEDDGNPPPAADPAAAE